MSDKTKVKSKSDPLLGADEARKEPDQPAKKPVEDTLDQQSASQPVATPAAVQTPAKATVGKDLATETKAILEKQPKVNFLVPLMEGESVPSYDTVQINTYKLTIQKGVMVSIPLAVANVLAEKYKVSMEVGKNMRVDRASNVEEALN